MSSVSCAIRFCFASGSDAIVRMLCKRSASLISRTRTSFAIATSILRIVAACCASLESNCNRSSLVTPSTIAATSAPNSASRSPSVTDVSSTASWSNAAASVRSSRPRSASIERDADGMRDVRVAGTAHLVLVRVARHLVRVLDERRAAPARARLQRLHERLQHAVDTRGTPPSPGRRRTSHRKTLFALSPSLRAGIPGSRTLRTPASDLRFAAITALLVIGKPCLLCRLRCAPGYPARGRSGLRRVISASLRSPPY